MFFFVCVVLCCCGVALLWCFVVLVLCFWVEWFWLLWCSVYLMLMLCLDVEVFWCWSVVMWFCHYLIVSLCCFIILIIIRPSLEKNYMTWTSTRKCMLWHNTHTLINMQTNIATYRNNRLTIFVLFFVCRYHPPLPPPFPPFLKFLNTNGRKNTPVKLLEWGRTPPTSQCSILSNISHTRLPSLSLARAPQRQKAEG